MALTLALPAVAAYNIQAELETDTIQSQGMIRGEGALTALLHPYSSSTGAVLPDFRLTAEHLRIETDYAETSIVISDASFAYQPVADTRTKHHSRITLSTEEINHGYRFSLFPLHADSAKITVDASCGAMTPSAEDEIRQAALVQFERDRPDTVVDVRDTLRWESCGVEAAATVEGEFWFSAWAIDFEIVDANGTHSYWSGHRDDEIVTEDQELYVYVTNGTLEVQLPADSDYALFRGASDVESSGSLQLSNAKGTLSTTAGEVDLGGERVTLDGDFTMGTRNRDGKIIIALVGDSDGAIIDGQSMVFPEPGAPGSELPWMLGFALLPVLLVVWWHQRPLRIERYHRACGTEGPAFPPEVRRERRGVGYWLLARGANGRHQHAKSLRLVRRSLRLYPGLPDARFLKAVSMSHLGDLGAALQEFEGVYGDLPAGRARARAACAAAATCIKAGDKEGAKAWLLLGLQEDLLFVARRVRRKSLYDALSDEPWFRSLREECSVDPAVDAAFA